MGRRKGQIAAMANLPLVKDRHRRQGRKPGDDSFLHTTELNDGTTYNRINFQSVTEQSNLEEFLNTAEVAGRDFTAERQAIEIISNPGQHVGLTRADMDKINEAQETHKASLQIPRRPPWDETTTKEQLILAEREAFTDWRRQLKMLEEEEHIQLTPYEKNLDFWRQLWRVIERSDVIVQIVDARNPLLFRCEDLENYVRQVDPDKTCMLLVNKADYLTAEQRDQWVAHFNKEGITAVFFSAKTEKEKQEGQQTDNSNLSSSFKEKGLGSLEEETDEEDGEESDDDDDKDKDESQMSSETSPKENENVEDKDKIENATVGSSVVDKMSSELEAVNVSERTELKPEECSNSTDPKFVSDKHSETDKNTSATTEEKCDTSESNPNCPELSSNISPSSSSTNSSSLVKNSTHIVSSDELLDIFRVLAQRAASRRVGTEVKTVGMVGYPNVGKSSTINVILEEKKLAVSATPGRTKHLQTLYVDPQLVLCDCPGLVFPSFVATKAHLVVNGILPIDEMRDHTPPVGLVCEHIPRDVLEATYSIMIPRPSLDDIDPHRAPTPEELLNAYGGMRGFMTQRGVPDCPRAARYILKDYVKGKLLYCEPPPGVEGPGFQDQARVAQLCQNRTVSKAPPPQIRSDIDQEFFNKRSGKAHSRGVRGVSDFIRTDTLQQTGRQDTDSLPGMSSGQSISSLASGVSTVGEGKPWKKHNNRKKKEKLRRLHKDLDIC